MVQTDIYKSVILFSPIAVLLVGCKSESNECGKPNILFIYTDDQADWNIGVGDNRQTYTPNLNRLASEGVWLKNFL